MKKLLYIFLFIPFTFLGQNNSYVEQDIPLSLPEGWSMFGFTCLEPINVINAFSLIEESVIIVKDNGGEAYLPEWNFNGMGVLEYSRGYQIKLTQEITDFQFCPAIVPLIDSDGDGVYDDDEIEGCMNISACNYNELATDVGICEFPIDGYDCEGNELPEYQVGDYAKGGIIFQINEDGTGLVAAMEDLEGTYQWGCYMFEVDGADGTPIGTGYQNTMDIVNQGCETENGGITAAQAALDAEIYNYSDWYLPSIGELVEMYNTIGNGAPEGNIGGPSGEPYWSSSEYDYGTANSMEGDDSYVGNSIKAYFRKVRVIRAFGSIIGCIDSLACNLSPEANTDDGSCEYAETDYNCDGNLLEACPYDIYVEYSADAQSYNANLCQTLIVLGCTDYIAENYNNQANMEDQSCTYIWACTDSNADNYYDWATQDDGSCIYFGCMDGLADNYNPQANQEDGSCIYFGCMNPTADNYDAQAIENDGNCIIYGCTLADFPNYNSEATVDDFSCDMSSADVFGCTNPNYLEYAPPVNQDNGTCSVEVVLGCTGPDHCNYNPEANTDDGSCIYTEPGYDCEGNFVPEFGDMIEGGIVFYIDETGEHGLVAALEDLPGVYEWGCSGTINLPYNTFIGAGYQNTLDIVAGCSQPSIAASEALAYESEGYEDWYLPSIHELVEMYNTIGNGSPDGNIGGFENTYYWSSSESKDNDAWSVNFIYGYTLSIYKSNTFRVRVIRAF